MGLEKFILNFFEFVGGINFNIFSFIIGLLFILFSLVIIGWVWIDSSERTSRKGLRLVYMLLVIFLNIPGLIIYLIIRPSETIEEIYWGDLERRYLKFETSELGDCPKCGHQLYPGYVFCTNCGFEIKKRCPKCNVLINKDHKFCEFCGLQIRDRATQEEKYPDAQVMQQQITATKEQASEVVESKRTRYKTGESFIVKLGNVIIGGFLHLKTKVKGKVDSNVVSETAKTDFKKIKKDRKKKNKKKESRKKR